MLDETVQRTLRDVGDIGITKGTTSLELGRCAAKVSGFSIGMPVAAVITTFNDANLGRMEFSEGTSVRRLTHLFRFLT